MLGKHIIHAKRGFSERKGLINFSDIVQTTTLNERTRNKIYGAIYDVFESFDDTPSLEFKLKDSFCEYFYEEVLSLTKNHIPLSHDIVSLYDYDKVFEKIYEIVQSYEYNEIFDLIECMIKTFNYVDNKIPYKYKSKEAEYINNINTIFNEENVNYRIISGIITDVVSDEEIKSIDDTIKNTVNVVSSHLQKALELLYKVKDYDNSIKESITAVESMCQIITKNNKASLGDALKTLKLEIHPALETAFEKLYGYTSDANGIRHANGIGEGNSSFAEAKYMLVSCSAFINYLNEQCNKKK